MLFALHVLNITSLYFLRRLHACIALILTYLIICFDLRLSIILRALFDLLPKYKKFRAS